MRALLVVAIFGFALVSDAVQAKFIVGQDDSQKLLMLAAHAAPYLARFDGRVLAVHSDPSGAVGLYDETGALAVCAGTQPACGALLKAAEKPKLAHNEIGQPEKDAAREQMTKRTNGINQIERNQPFWRGPP